MSETKAIVPAPPDCTLQDDYGNAVTVVALECSDRLPEYAGAMYILTPSGAARHEVGHYCAQLRSGRHRIWVNGSPLPDFAPEEKTP